jgi:hypothetical protein
MKTTDILFIILWTSIIIEIILILVPIFRTRQLNHIPRFNYPFEEVCFEITNIKYITRNVVEYTAVVCFFKKPNAKHFIYNEYRFYDAKYKYNIGEKLYLNKKQ